MTLRRSICLPLLLAAMLTFPLATGFCEQDDGKLDKLIDKTLEEVTDRFVDWVDKEFIEAETGEEVDENTKEIQKNTAKILLDPRGEKTLEYLNNIEETIQKDMGVEDGPDFFPDHSSGSDPQPSPQENNLDGGPVHRPSDHTPPRWIAVPKSNGKSTPQPRAGAALRTGPAFDRRGLSGSALLFAAVFLCLALGVTVVAMTRRGSIGAATGPKRKRHAQSPYALRERPTARRFCTQCGHKLFSSDRFCRGCGHGF